MRRALVGLAVFFVCASSPAFSDHRSVGKASPLDQEHGADPYGWDSHWRADKRFNWQAYRTAHGKISHLGRFSAPHGDPYERYDAGQYLPPIHFISGDFWLKDATTFHLPPAPTDTGWVRYYNDALLIDARTGYIIDAVYGIFR